MDNKKRIEERKKALEAKRKRLEELRRNKSGATATVNHDNAAADTVAKAVEQQKQEREQVDDLVNNLLKSAPAAAIGEEKENTHKQHQQQQSEKQQQQHQEAQGQENARAENVVRSSAENVVLKRTCDLGTVNIPLRDVVTYEKGAQTDPMPITLLDGNDTESLASPLRRSSRKSFETMLTDAANREHLGSSFAEPAPQESDETQDNGLPRFTVPTDPLDEEEKALIESDQGFLHFMSQGARVVERAMKQNTLFDFAIDYGGLESTANATLEKVVPVKTILDERWSKDRTVTEMQWSPHHKELFLASYTKRQFASDMDWSRGTTDPNGVVLLWSTHMADERPEYIFTCQSPVHTAKFHPYAANIVVGGTYCGEVVMWDLRAKSVPVQRSHLSPESHTHPVYSMEITGSANAHSLVSVSTDGRMCIWSLANLSQPTETRMLKWNKKEISTTCLAFPDGETNELCVGTDDGRIMRAQVHGSKSGIQSSTEAHFAPVTALHFHKGSSVLSDLMLSASVDWSVKLWSFRQSEVPLASFDASDDYIFDVKWSPVHPAVFATVNGSGFLDIWNINVDLEVPQARHQVNTNGAALSCLQWAPGGKRILVGDARGKIHTFEVASDLASPKRDEWSRLENLVAGLAEASLTSANSNKKKSIPVSSSAGAE